MRGIAEWLASIGLGEYTQRFAANAIDLSVVRDLTEQDLKDLGVLLGHRRKILRAIAELDSVAPAPTETATKPALRVDAERRHLTVMICDLVGSTALSARLDPEDMRAVIDAYHAACARITRTYDGFLAEFRGDGILAYFGYPIAHEDDAERTVRAGLDIIAAVARLETRAAEPLAVRIGIATGVVVVGEGELREHAVVGETPNLAARLQALGEPGIGKSRLAAALAERIAGEPHTRLRYQCSPYHTNSALRPFIAQLERAAGFKADDTSEQRLDKLEAVLAMGASQVQAVAPLFAALLSIPFGKRYPPLALTPTQQRRRTLAALLDQFEGLARQQPILLSFEDAHWADATSLELLDLTVERVRQLPVLALFTFRPEFEPPWVGLPNVGSLTLGRLSSNDVENMVARVTAGRVLPVEVMKQIVSKTDGNPLFVEELTKTVLETGILVEDAEVYRLEGPLPPLAIPETLQDSLMARLDRLAPVREIAQLGAAIGREFSYSLVRALVGRDETALKHGLAQLEQAGLVFRRGEPPEAVYSFKHALVRDAAYESVLKSRRHQLHGQIARALEERFAEIVASQPEIVAHHFTEAGLVDPAIEYWLKAGVKAYSLYANEDAVRFFERALTLLKKLPETRDNLERAVDICFQLRNALLPLGKTDRILRSLDELDPILARLGDKQRSAQYAAFRCNHHFLIGQQRRAIEFGETGVRLARECGDRVVLGQSLFRLAQSYHALGEYRRAISLLEQGLEFNANELRHDRHNLNIIPSVLNRTWLAIALVECGDFSAGMRHARRALEIAEGAEHQLSKLLGWLSIGYVLSHKGEIAGAVGALERGLDLSDRWSFRVWRIRLVSDLGVAYARFGRAEKGLQLAEQAVSDGDKMQLIADKPRLLIRLGQVSLIARQIETALTLGKQAAAIAAVHEAKGDEAWARFLIGRAYLAASEPKNLDESEKQLDIALRLATACEARPLAAFCNTALCRIYARRGDQVRGKEVDAVATATYRDLDMQPLPL